MRRLIWVMLGLVLIAGLLSRGPVNSANPFALTDRNYSIDDLVWETEALVEATVVDEVAKYDSKDRHVYTFSSVRIDQSVWGPLKVGDETVLRVRGGHAGEFSSEPLPDLVPPRVGERYLLFLVWHQSDLRPELSGWYLAGGWRGIAAITKDDQLTLANESRHPLAPWQGRSVKSLEEMLMTRAR